MSVTVVSYQILLSKYCSINQNIEKESGGGEIHITAMMSFQEIGDRAGGTEYQRLKKQRQI